MDNITVVELWAYLLSAIAVFKTLEWLWDKFVTPKLKKDEQLKNMENTLIEIKEKLNKDFEKLSNHDMRLKTLEQKTDDSSAEVEDTRKALKVIIVGQQAITKSLLEDGNNKSGLKEAEKALEEYLTSKV